MVQAHLTGKTIKLSLYLWVLVSSSCYTPLHSLSPLPTHSQSKKEMSEAVIRRVFLALIHFVACLHSMLDPQQTWRRYFIPDRLGWEGMEVVPAPAELIPLSVSILTLNKVPPHFDLCPRLHSDLRVEVLYMLGALLSSEEVTTLSLWCPLTGWWPRTMPGEEQWQVSVSLS